MDFGNTISVHFCTSALGVAVEILFFERAKVLKHLPFQKKYWNVKPDPPRRGTPKKQKC